MLKRNDVIPVGWSKGLIEVIANENGLKFLPTDSINKGKGFKEYYTVHIPVNDINAIILMMLGVSFDDIKRAGMNNGKTS